MSTMIEQPISAGTILKKSVNLYTSTFSKILPILIIFALFLPFTKLIISNIYNSTGVYSQDHLTSNIDLLKIVSIGVLFSLLTLFLNSSMIYLSSKHIKNETITLFQGLKKAFNKLFTIACSYIVLVLTIILIGAICYFFGKMTIDAIGLLILSILLVIIMIRMNFFLPAILWDNAGILSSLSESYKLTIKYWWRTFGLTLVAGLPHVPFIMAQHFVAPQIAILLQILDIIIVTPFTYNLLLLQFFDLKVRHGVVAV